MIKLTDCNYQSQSCLLLKFSDGSESQFNLASYLQERNGSLLQPLHQPCYAQRVFIEAGALCWPNGLCLSPARLHEYTQAKKVA